MKTLQILLLVFVTFYTVTAYGQMTKLDSLRHGLQNQKNNTAKVKSLLDLSGGLLANSEYTEALRYANDAIGLSKELSFREGESDSRKTIGDIFARQYNWKEARRNYLAYLTLREELGDKGGIAEAYLNVAGTFNGESNYPESLKNVYNALKIYEELNDKTGIAQSNLMIGLLHFMQKDDMEALQKLEECLKLQVEERNLTGAAQTYNILGEIYLRQGNYSAALANDSSALKIYRESGQERGMAAAFGSIGKVFEKLGVMAMRSGDNITGTRKLQEAKDNFLLAVDLWINSGSKMGEADAYLNLGQLNMFLKNFGEAKEYLQKSLEVSYPINSKETIRDSYLNLSLLDSLSGKYERAYHRYKMYVLYRDSLINEEATRKSFQTKMQYEFDRKEAIAKAAQDKKDDLTRRTRNFQYFAIGTALLIAFFLFINSRQKQKAKRKVEIAYQDLKSTQAQLIQSEKMASLGELTAGIAHEIQNPLNFVNNFSEVNTELIDELKAELATGNMHQAIEIVDDIKENEQKINHHGKRADAIVKGMLQHSRSSSGVKEPTNINTLADEYLRLAYHGLRAKDESFNATLKTDFDEAIGNINIVPQDIGRVILNIITNAFYAVNEKTLSAAPMVKYEPIVSISTKKLNHKVEIRVADNGNGVPQKILDKIFQPFFTTKPTGQGTGLGLSLSYDIIKAHAGEIKVETKDGEGSLFIIEIPIA